MFPAAVRPPRSSPARCNIFISWNVHHETFRDIRSEGREGGCVGLRGVDHEMFRDLLAVASMHISEP